jgi:hypothetical protein
MNPCFDSDGSDDMKNSNTPKIVVAVGLAAVYGTGLAMLRHAPDINIAQKPAVVATAPHAAEPPSPASIVADSPAAPTIAPAPVVSAAESRPAAATREVASETKARSTEAAVAKAQEVGRVATPSSTERNNIPMSSPTGEIASVGNEPAMPAAEAPSSEQAGNASSGSVDVVTEDAAAE